MRRQIDGQNEQPTLFGKKNEFRLLPERRVNRAT
jgi:hypothetical protein